MKILKDPQEIRNFEFKELLKEYRIDTIDQLYSFLYPYDSGHENIIIRKRWYDKPKTTVINRINMIWVFPIFWLLIPIRYVLYENFSVNPNTRLGKILKYLLGNGY